MEDQLKAYSNAHEGQRHRAVPDHEDLSPPLEPWFSWTDPAAYPRRLENFDATLQHVYPLAKTLYQAAPNTNDSSFPRAPSSFIDTYTKERPAPHGFSSV